jgi:hypothetical protein
MQLVSEDLKNVQATGNDSQLGSEPRSLEDQEHGRYLTDQNGKE